MGRSVAEAARKLTYEDYRRIPEDGKRHEIIEGEDVVSGSPTDAHQRVSLNLSTALHVFLRQTRLGKLRVAPYDTLLDAHNVFQPDLLVVLDARAAQLEEHGCHGAPDLVIEILSDSSGARDRVKKRRVYERTGVREYWVVDAESERIEVYRPESRARRYGRPVVLSAERGDRIETELLPGFALPLAEVFAE